MSPAKLLIVVALCCAPVYAQTPAEKLGTLAEKLGHPKTARLLILHGDDLGMCRAANAAAEEAFVKGVMNSGSAMVPCPWFPQIAAWAKANPKHDLGLHLTLTSEWKYYRWRPLSAGKGLIDPDGFMWRKSEDVAANAKASEVEAEIRAQIARARKLGLEPTHLDSHMGAVFYSPAFFSAYLKVAKELRIVPMISQPTKKMEVMLRAKGQLGMAKMFLGMTARLGYPILDRLVSTQGKTYEQRRDHLLEVIRELPAGSTQVILHPATAGPELRHITNSHRGRADDLKMLLDPAVRTAIEKSGVTLVTWRSINAMWKKQLETSKKPGK